MKKMILTFILILIFQSLRAPEYRVLYIEQPEGISFYEPLIRAVVGIESSYGRILYNKDENAVGWFQIRQCRVDDYNKLTGSNYKLSDFYDYNLSREMFLYYAKGKTFERAAKNWNGSGRKTIEYWNKVKLLL